MRIGITKQFLSQFDRTVKANDILGSAIIDALLTLKRDPKSHGINLETLRSSDFNSIRVGRNYRIILSLENDTAYLLYLGGHFDAYEWSRKNRAIRYHDYLIGFLDTDLYEDAGDEADEDEAFSGFDESFQRRLHACKGDVGKLRNLCSVLPPEYREIVLSMGLINEAKDGYSSEICVVEEDEDLRQALEKSFQEWMVFLHPIQKGIIDYPKDKNLSICGGPGTGKTVSLVHRLIRFIKDGNRCALLSKSEATMNVIKNMISQFESVPMPDCIYMDDIDEDRVKVMFQRYDYFFFDEFQDIGRHQCLLLYDEFRKTNKHFTMAYDLNQAVYTTKNKKEILESFNELADETQILNYNYRCTDEIFEAAAKFIRFQRDRLKLDTFDMDFALIGNEAEYFEESDDDIDVAIKDFVLKKNYLIGGDWAIVFAGYYNERQFNALKELFPDNVFNVLECKGMDFRTGIVVIYNDDFRLDNQIGFREFNTQSYVAITRFRDSVAIFFVKEKYEDTPRKNMVNIHDKPQQNSQKGARKKDRIDERLKRQSKKRRLELKIKHDWDTE